MIAIALKGLRTLGFLKRNKNNGNHTPGNVKTSVSDISAADSNESDNPVANLELIAVITAALQAFMGTGRQNRLIVKSFRRISSDNSVWNTTSRYEQLNGKL